MCISSKGGSVALLSLSCPCSTAWVRRGASLGWPWNIEGLMANDENKSGHVLTKHRREMISRTPFYCSSPLIRTLQHVLVTTWWSALKSGKGRSWNNDLDTPSRQKTGKAVVVVVWFAPNFPILPPQKIQHFGKRPKLVRFQSTLWWV